MVFRAFCVLTLGKAQIYLVFNSLNRTSDLKVEGTPVREFQRKRCFSLEFHSLNRTFVCEIY